MTATREAVKYLVTLLSPDPYSLHTDSASFTPFLYDYLLLPRVTASLLTVVRFSALICRKTQRVASAGKRLHA